LPAIHLKVYSIPIIYQVLVDAGVHYEHALQIRCDFKPESVERSTGLHRINHHYEVPQFLLVVGDLKNSA
jgi:hypothetical protein